MKKILVVLAVTLGAGILFGASTPYKPEEEARFVAVEARTTLLEVIPNAAETTAYATDGIMEMRLAKGRLNCAVSSDCSIGNHSMGVSLPANAVIVRAFGHINHRFADSGPGSVQIGCEDAGNVLASGDITGALKNTVISGVASGDASVMQSAIAASCVVTAAVGGAQPSSGDLSIYLQYVVHPQN